MSASSLLAKAAGFALAASALAGAVGAGAADIAAVGATFPAPLYLAWATAYRAATGERFNYQPIGSGAGIRQIAAGTVDVGATDRPLTPAELAAANLYQLPMVVGGIVPVINLPGLRAGRMKLNGGLLADIFLGAITRWDDPRLRRANPQLRLPPVPITVVHRSDGSGTSFLFTSFLAAASPRWAAAVGAGDAVDWPRGLGGKGNDGVAAFVKQSVGAIGYVEYAYAGRNRAAYALVCNRAGRCPVPAPASFSAAAAGADWSGAGGNDVLLLDRPAADAWPITGATFLLLRRAPADRAARAAALRFVDWAYRAGDATAARLGYVPLPPAAKAAIRRQWPGVDPARSASASVHIAGARRWRPR